MRLHETLENTRKDLLEEIKKAEIPKDLKKVLFIGAKKMNLLKLYCKWTKGGYDEWGFQYSIKESLIDWGKQHYHGEELPVLPDICYEIVAEAIP